MHTYEVQLDPATSTGVRLQHKAFSATVYRDGSLVFTDEHGALILAYAASMWASVKLVTE